MPYADRMVHSPCNGVCAIDPATGLCRGCFRTLDEIADRGTTSDEGRREVLATLESRKLNAAQTSHP